MIIDAFPNEDNRYCLTLHIFQARSHDIRSAPFSLCKACHADRRWALISGIALCITGKGGEASSYHELPSERTTGSRIRFCANVVSKGNAIALLLTSAP